MIKLNKIVKSVRRVKGVKKQENLEILCFTSSQIKFQTWPKQKQMICHLIEFRTFLLHNTL